MWLRRIKASAETLAVSPAAFWILLTLLLLCISGIKTTAVAVSVKPVAGRILFTFILLWVIGVEAAAETLAVSPATLRVALTLLLWAGRCRYGWCRRIDIYDNCIAVAAAGGKYSAMSSRCVGVIPYVVVARLDKSQVVAHHVIARVELIQVN